MRKYIPFLLFCFALLPLQADEQFALQLPLADEHPWAKHQSSFNQQTVIGPFTNDKLELKLEALPKHQTLTVKIKLAIIGKWIGNGNKISGHMAGPNWWGMYLNDGRHLIHTTFSNDRVYTQSYPDYYPSTNARPKGINLLQNEKNQPFTVYEFETTIFHSAEKATLTFYAMGLGTNQDRQWAIQSLSVSAGDRRLKNLKMDNLKKKFKALSKAEAVSNADLLEVVGQGDQILKVIESSNKKDDDIEKLIKQLDHDDYDKREEATETLKSKSKAIAGAIKQAMKTASPEQLYRLEDILDNLSDADEKSAANHPLALHVLELIGTKEALAVYKRLSINDAAPGSFTIGNNWAGWCDQSAHTGYPMNFITSALEDGKYTCELYWPTLNNSRSKWVGKKMGNHLSGQEVELLKGNGIIIPVDYEMVIVGEEIYGMWINPNNKKEWGTYKLKPALNID